MSNNDVILEVKNLHTYFNTDAGVVKAVNGVNYNLNKGEVLGIVGESGSGKSVTSLSIMSLIPSPPGKIVDGEVLFNGKNLLKMSDRELRSIRGDKIAMIFQDPMTSLNPFLRISTQLMETIELHQKLNKEDARAKAIEMLTLVGIPSPEQRINNYPHQFSGGMRQRVMIAMALSCNPEVLIADEPTTALDVTIQAQILDLIKDLSKRLNTAVIMITHDLGVVAGMCDSVCVMYAGKVVEKASNDDIFNNPKHPYTEGLIKSVPRLDKATSQKLYSIEGQPPNVIDLPECCPFHPRCDKAMDKCRNTYPPEVNYENGRQVRCWLYEGDK
ncbi:ABC transporter ATP-binding protein [Thiospirochaeta perfilievii]|uniref:ABC transporter ATP-binding protein n=1 Tax=Thiospirochaeta perfilievii TaxID=252967 RepID=A0A5C1QDP3_9SPIO|nr:ABC transporter ATP-binding protein [Thiospirochaeta perfilievii]QEN06195.1 ABC transporter ATP-binding protein [Thiospirochaeta perfilievii]